MATKTVSVEIYRDGPMCFIPVPFDPKVAFGKVRAPVRVTLNGHSYPSTIASMGNGPCIPLRKSNREAAGVDSGQVVKVKIELDTQVRTVEVPPDLKKALARSARARKAWELLSYSHRKEHVDALLSAKKPETRARRLAAALLALQK
jgi:Bacteriocin-protection, YdeI or OmpD-Associated/Domain of unknown function (DUF1905)